VAISRGAIRDLLFPGLAGVIMAYPEIPKQWPGAYDSMGTSKMALERYVEARPVGLAQLKAEGGATAFDNASGERFTWNIEMVAIGLGTAITREALDDNLYKDNFGPQSMGLAESFAQTWEILHANILNNGASVDYSTGGDGLPLFSTQHTIDTGVYANTPSTQADLSEAALEAAFITIRSFPDQAGIKKFFRAKKLIVPPSLEFVAERLTKTELRVGTANNDVNAFLSAGALPEGYQVMDFLTSPFAWFIKTTAKGMIHYDRIPYEMDLQIDPVTGNLMILAYERCGYNNANPRAIYGSQPSN
jgi:hypothetical protein